MSLDYQEYLHGGLLNGRYLKVKGINEGSFGIVSVAKDTFNNDKLVAVKYNTGKLSDFAAYQQKAAETRSFSLNSRTKSVIKSNATYSHTDRTEADISRSVVVRETIMEINMLNKVGYHPNITQLIDSFETYMIMEYAHRGDLHDAIHLGIAPVDTRDVINVFMQLINAIDHCHKHGVYHRDIKPENILITENWTIQLTDFGLATDKLICKDFDVGSERYMAPELLEHSDISSYAADKVDIWSLGICMLNIVFGKSPFTSASSKDKAFLHFATNREILLDIFPAMSYDLFSVMMNSLTIDPANRDLEMIKESLQQIEVLTYDDEFEYEEKIKDDIIEESPILPPTPESKPEISLATPNTSIGTDTEENESEHHKNYETIDSLLHKADHSTITPVIIDKPKKYEPPRRIYVDLDNKDLQKKHKNRGRFNLNQRKPITVPDIHITADDNLKDDDFDFKRKDFFTPKSVFADYIERANRGKKDLKKKGNYYKKQSNSSTCNSNTGSTNGNTPRSYNRNMRAWKKRKRRFSYLHRDGYQSNHVRSGRSGRSNRGEWNKKLYSRSSIKRRSGSQQRKLSQSIKSNSITLYANKSRQHRPSRCDGKAIMNGKPQYESVFSDDDDDIFDFEVEGKKKVNKGFKLDLCSLSKQMNDLKFFDDKSSSRETSLTTFSSRETNTDKYIPPHHRRHSASHYNQSSGILKKPMINLQLNSEFMDHSGKKQVKIVTPISSSVPTQDPIDWFRHGIGHKKNNEDDDSEDLFAIDEDRSFNNMDNSFKDYGIAIKTDVQ